MTPVVGGSGPQAPPQAIRRGASRFAGRTWALEQVLDWLEPGGSRFLVVQAKPGVGKSAFVAWLAGYGRVPSDVDVADKLAAVRSALSAVHFCRAKAGGTVDPAGFAGSIARQLTDGLEGFGRYAWRHVAPEININQVVGENLGQTIGVKAETLIVGGKNVGEAYNKAVRLPLQDLYAEGGHQSQVVIVVDGLDESFLNGSLDILDLLAASEDFPEAVRFLVTTREDERISDLSEWTLLDLSGEENAARNDEDVREYLEQRLAEEAIQRRAGVAADTGAIIDNLVARAAGNFLYVEFLLDEVEGGTRDLADLSGVPTDLYPLYRGYLKRILPFDPDPSAAVWHKQYQPLLGSLAVAAPAAPKAVLPRWLRLDDDELATRLARLAQLTEEVPAVLDGVGYRVYHRSLADFLATDEYPDRGRRTRNAYYVAPAKQHRRIAKHYLDTGPGPERDWRRLDRYGVRQLVTHLHAWLELTTDPEEQDEAADHLYAVISDEAFVARQRAENEVGAAATGIRLAVAAAVQRGDVAAIEAMVLRLARNLDPELRAVARESAQRLQEIAPDRFSALARQLLG